MSNPRYPEEFKIQAVNQVTEKKLPVAEVAARLGVSTHNGTVGLPTSTVQKVLANRVIPSPRRW